MLPDGYILLQDEGERIVVGMKMRLLGSNCVSHLEHGGKVFRAGGLELVPDGYAGELCSAREYVVDRFVTPKPQAAGFFH